VSFFLGVFAMKIRFVPSVTASTEFNYVPGFVFHDPKAVSAPGTISTYTNVQFENRKLVNFQRPWN
jgi:hypothetical protein